MTITGPVVKFKTKTYTFEELTSELLKLEQEHNLTTIDMFSHYLRGDYDHDEKEEWVDLFLLWLGTSKMREYSMPKVEPTSTGIWSPLYAAVELSLSKISFK